MKSHMKSLMVLSGPVLIVEDEPLSHQRFHNLLLKLGFEPEQLHSAATLATAQTLANQFQWQLVLVDLGLPDGMGSTLIAQLSQQYPDLPILVISAFSSEEHTISALKAGASGYLLKERDDFEIEISIRNVLAGGSPIDPFIARRLMREFQSVTATPVDKVEYKLTEREQEVLEYIAQGLSNRKIAEAMVISSLTVDTHVKRIYRKLAVSSRVQAVRAAQADGLLS